MRFPKAILSTVIISAEVYSAVLTVPGQYESIQAGLDAAVNGDTVLVSPGIYSGTGNVNLLFRGRNIVLKSFGGAEVTIIDCQNRARGIMFVQGESRNAVVEGFTITHGFTESEEMGGGILTYGSSPTIRGNILSGNYAYYGGGVGCYGGAPLIENNLITSNGAERGGGVACFGGTQAVISDNVISFNRSNGG